MSNSQRAVCALGFIIGSICVLRKQKKLVWPLLAAYVFAVIFVTLLNRSPYQKVRISLKAFKALKKAFFVKGKIGFYFKRMRHLKQIFLNILLFVPLGYFLPTMMNWAKSWWKALLFGLAVSLGIELLQYSTLLGMFDVDDLINNTIGAWIGWIGWRVFLSS